MNQLENKPFCLRKLRWLSWVLCLAMPMVSPAQSLIYGISAPGFFFQVTNVPANSVYPGANPTLVLTAGATYRLFMGTSSIHPVVIATNNTGGFGNPPLNFGYAGATPQNTFSGAVTVTIPASNYPPVLYYQCNFHFFFGQINILPPPPRNEILSLSVTTNVVLISTGVTNTWQFIPEFSSNLVSGAWAKVPNFTNSFASGTNVTRFGRLEPICGPNVFLRIRQTPPN